MTPAEAGFLFCLAANVYHEARGEPIEGQFGVALVTLNRAERRLDKICKVVYAKKQFSWTNTKPHPLVKDPVAWEQAKAVARLSLHMADFTGGATHYHALSVSPYWRDDMVILGQWGSHVFYKEERK